MKPKSALVEQLDSEEFDWFDTMGGWRGIAESTTPLLVFLIAYAFTQDLWLPAAGAAGVSVVFVLIRLITRIPVMPAVSGLMGVGISVAWAAWSGKSENYFAFGLISAAVMLTILLMSLLVKQPAAAHVLNTVWNLPNGWMRNPSYRLLYQRCRTVTWLWIILFGVRLVAQVPLWMGAQVESLAVVKLVTGLPLFAVVAWLTWLMLRSFAHLSTVSVEEGTPVAEEN